MVIADIDQLRLLRGAFLAAAVAARVEAAAFRRVDGARHITFQHVLHRGDVRVGNRNRPQQRLRVRMQRVVEQFLLRRNFDDVAQIPRYITAMRSQMCLTTLRLCEMKMYVS